MSPTNLYDPPASNESNTIRKNQDQRLRAFCVLSHALPVDFCTETVPRLAQPIAAEMR